MTRKIIELGEDRACLGLDNCYNRIAAGERAQELL